MSCRSGPPPGARRVGAPSAPGARPGPGTRPAGCDRSRWHRGGSVRLASVRPVAGACAGAGPLAAGSPAPPPGRWRVSGSRAGHSRLAGRFGGARRHGAGRPPSVTGCGAGSAGTPPPPNVRPCVPGDPCSAPGPLILAPLAGEDGASRESSPSSPMCARRCSCRPGVSDQGCAGSEHLPAGCPHPSGRHPPCPIRVPCSGSRREAGGRRETGGSCTQRSAAVSIQVSRQWPGRVTGRAALWSACPGCPHHDCPGRCRPPEQ